MLPTVEDTEHHESVLINPVLHHVRRVEYAQDDLPEFAAGTGRFSERWPNGQNVDLGNDFTRNDRCRTRICRLEESGETIEIGESAGLFNAIYKKVMAHRAARPPIAVL